MTPTRVVYVVLQSVGLCALVTTLSACTICNPTTGLGDPVDTGSVSDTGVDNDTTTSTDMDADEDMDTTADVTDAEDDIVQSDADDTGPTMTDGTVAAFGLVLRIVEPSGEVQPEEGAAVVLSNDQNGDGAVDSGEQCTTTTDAQGRFSVECGAVTGRRMVLSITAPGASPMYRTVDAQSGAQTQWQVTLREQQPLVCEGDQCALDSGAVIIGNVPDGISAQAWTLGSSATADERPSESIDRSGNLLLPGVTAAVTWLDINGNPLPDLETPVTTWIRYPRAAWGRLDDMDSANSTIDLPLYLLDPLSGRWVRQGMGTLVDVTGSAIDPAALETLQEGNWEGVAFVQAELALSGVWSVQWALETRSCVQGVLNSDAVPVAGALVRLEGLGYDGRTAPALTDAQGSFCIETLRGEQNGEDLDRDGVAGEVYEARLEASVGGNQLFDLGSHMLRSDESACGEGGCLSLGEVGLATNVFEAGTCPVAGLVTDRFGQPVQGTQLHAWSQAELSDATFDELCGDGCTTETTSDENGIFLLNGIPYMGTLTLYANTQEVLATRSRQFSGSLRLEECPTGSVTVVLDQGYERLSFEVNLNGDTITWSPGTPLVQLDVTDGSGNLKWSIQNVEGIDDPVVYGTVPDGAELLSADDEPAALGSGDTVTVWTHITPPGGYTTLGMGTLVLP